MKRKNIIDIPLLVKYDVLNTEDWRADKMILDTRLTMKQVRLIKGYSQQELAEMLGVHKQTVGKWERNANDMPLGKVKKFAEIVQMEMDQIEFVV